MDKYAVFGNPIAHSKSPQIHTAFAQQTEQNLIYDKREAPLDAFEETVRQFLSENGKGFNITVPFKEHAWRWADELSPLAQKAGAVNTIVFDGEKTVGHNTDGIGLVRDITVNHGIELKAKRVLMLGAGGAVRGVIEPLMQQQPASLTIANRTPAKAQTLAELFADSGLITGCGFEDLAGEQFDIIINGTAAGLSNEVPPIPDNVLMEGGVTYDMCYASEPTAFVHWGQEHGAQLALDGLGMLIEQAAEAFLLWRGVRPDTRDIIHGLRTA